MLHLAAAVQLQASYRLVAPMATTFRMASPRRRMPSSMASSCRPPNVARRKGHGFSPDCASPSAQNSRPGMTTTLASISASTSAWFTSGRQSKRIHMNMPARGAAQLASPDRWRAAAASAAAARPRYTACVSLRNSSKRRGPQLCNISDTMTMDRLHGPAELPCTTCATFSATGGGLVTHPMRYPGPSSFENVSMRTTRPSTSNDRKLGGSCKPGIAPAAAVPPLASLLRNTSSPYCSHQYASSSTITRSHFCASV
mmetsp:Transcript_16628/g.49686  ORF Transcript_16628/g.49686 Transcript_16628/m.49686 type:complete len:256 (+) Transcript_16628:411-1178(+)